MSQALIASLPTISGMLLCICVITCVVACEKSTTPSASTSNQNSSAMNTTPVAPAISQDVNALASVLPLDPRPVAVSWQHKVLGSNRVTDIPGPTDYSLTAVLQYRDEDVDAVVAAAAKMAPAAIGDVAWQDWFPAALKPFATTSRDGNLVLTGERYQSHQIKRAPLSQGSLVRIGKTNYFVLSLFTM